MTKQELQTRKQELEVTLAGLENGAAAIPAGFTKEELIYSATEKLNSVTHDLARLDEQEKRDAAEKAKADAAKAKKRTELQGIIDHLPEDFKATLGEDRWDGPFIRTEKDATIELKNIYSSSWRSTVMGTKLTVNAANYEHRHFPRKKDGTFSIDKVIAFINDNYAAKQAKQTAEGKAMEKLIRFNQLIRPYKQYQAYRVEAEFSPADNLKIKVGEHYNGGFYVTRSTTEVVTEEQLIQILANEVPKVQRDEEKEAQS